MELCAWWTANWSWKVYQWMWLINLSDLDLKSILLIKNWMVEKVATGSFNELICSLSSMECEDGLKRRSIVHPAAKIQSNIFIVNALTKNSLVHVFLCFPWKRKLSTVLKFIPSLFIQFHAEWKTQKKSKQNKRIMIEQFNRNEEWGIKIRASSTKKISSPSTILLDLLKYKI